MKDQLIGQIIKMKLEQTQDSHCICAPCGTDGANIIVSKDNHAINAE
jgi:hypothetical protein